MRTFSVLVAVLIAGFSVPADARVVANVTPAGKVQFSGSVDAQVSAALKRHQNGGVGLTAALSALLARDPGLATDVAAALAGANDNQKLAGAAALAKAYAQFKADNPAAADAIRRASSLADPAIRQAFDGAIDSVVASDRGGGGGSSSSGGSFAPASSGGGPVSFH